jgi:heat shock protein HslJ/uncharacterized membrane protein
MLSRMIDRRAIIVLSAAALLSGCATLPAPAPETTVPTGEAWFALGTEPFWSLEITQSRITYHDAERRRVTEANPGAQTSLNGRRYAGQRMTVDISMQPCSDGMSDRRYAETVRLTMDGRTLNGCGGAIVPPAGLDGTNWRIVSIDGSAINAERGGEMRFEGNRISASAGCNRLTGSFTSDGTRLTASQIAATRMACPTEIMGLEMRLSQMLRQSLAIRFTPDGRMMLTGDGGATIVLERII